MLTPRSIRLPGRGALGVTVAVLLVLFALTALVRFRLHPNGGHAHRQTDTLGMALAFAEEWRARGPGALDFLVYPRVLQRGLSDGINASEFPLLDVLGGFFFLGGDPRRGVFLLALLVLAVNVAVAAFWLPRLLRAFRVEASPLASLLVWFAGAGTAYQATVVMPEGLALPLAVVGATLLIEARGLSGLVLGSAVCAAAAAVKPTAAIALGAVPALLALAPERRAAWRSRLVALNAALAFPLWWYTAHARHIRATAQGPQIFALAPLDPWGNLAALGPHEILGLLLREPHQGQLPMLAGWWFVLAALVVGEARFALLYLAALLGGMALGGPAVIVHGYYFVGAAAFACLLMARVWGALQNSRWLRLVTVACLLWGVAWGIRVNVWLISRAAGQDALWDLGRQVREQLPPGTHLVTDDGMFPRKLLFVGRSGTAAGDRFDAVADDRDYRSRPLALLGAAPPPDSLPWAGRVATRRVLPSPAETWYLVIMRPAASAPEPR